MDSDPESYCKEASYNYCAVQNNYSYAEVVQLLKTQDQQKLHIEFY